MTKGLSLFFKRLSLFFNKKKQKTFKLNIGLDLDGPIFQQEAFQIKYGVKYFKNIYIKDYYKKTGIKLKKSDVKVLDSSTNKELNGKKEIDLLKPHIVINSRGYSIRQEFNCSEEEEKIFWIKNMIKYALFVPINPDSARILNKLNDENYGIFINSSRAKADEQNIIGFIQRSIVIFRLKLAKIPHEKITFSSYKEEYEVEQKTQVCKDNNIDINIEDKKSIAESIEKNTKAISLLYATRNNSDINNKDIKRYVDWNEFYNAVKRLENNQNFEKIPVVKINELTDDEKHHYFEKFKEYLIKTYYDQETIKKREARIQRLVKYGKIFFDIAEKSIIINASRKPKEDGVILTTNHRDMLDIPTLMGAVGPKPYYGMLKSEFLETPFGQILTNINFGFIDRNDKSCREQSKETAARRILHGSDIVICPEGTRNTVNDTLLEFGLGAVTIARNTGRPIYPVAQYKSLYGRIVNFGKPIYVKQTDDVIEANKILYNETLKLYLECQKYEAQRMQAELQSNKKRILRKVS